LDSAVFVEKVEVDGGVTVPSVESELVDSGTRLFYDTHRPEVRLPVERFMDEVREAARDSGDLSVMSETDVEVLALALQVREEGEEPVVLTDDYAVQNVASRLGLEFEGLGQRGIEEEFEWEWFCRGCGRVFDSRREDCPVCGSGLKRRRSG